MKHKRICSVKLKVATLLGGKDVRRSKKILSSQQAWWYTSLVPVLWRQRQVLCEFQASLVYLLSSRPARAIEVRPYH